jgi:hypothetical protein
MKKNKNDKRNKNILKIIFQEPWKSSSNKTACWFRLTPKFEKKKINHGLYSTKTICNYSIDSYSYRKFVSFIYVWSLCLLLDGENTSSRF